MKGLLTRETGKAILTGKITGNAVGDGNRARKTFAGIVVVLVVVFTFVVVKIVEFRRVRKHKKTKKKKR